jgi:hypothetical protein
MAPENLTEIDPSLRRRVGRSFKRQVPEALSHGRLSRMLVALAMVLVGVVAVEQAPVGANGCDAVEYESTNRGDVGQDPIVISSRGHLVSLSATPADWGKHFVQTADIDLAGCDWTPIGRRLAVASVTYFSGIYDGNGFTISGLTVELTGGDNTETPYVGLFGRAQEAIFRDIHLEDVWVVTESTGAGGLVGWLEDSSVSDVSLRGTLNVSAKGQVGGLIGWSTSSAVTATTVSATGTVTGSDQQVGGLIGLMDEGSVSNSSVVGSLSFNMTSEGLGGLIGAANGGTVQQVFVSSTVVVSSGSMSVGGLIGVNYAAVSDARSDASVSGTDNVGGLIGVNDGSITNSFATGTVVSGGWAGGLAGGHFQSAITNSYATGDVTGGGFAVGGLIGYFDSGSLANAHASGSVTGSGSAVGGLIGYLAPFFVNIEIDGVYATGNVIGASEVGGLIGDVDTSFGSVAIENAHGAAAVEGVTNVGGLVGRVGSHSTNTAVFENSYATGSVEGLTRVGGLVGNNPSNSTIRNSYATGAVTGGTGSIQVGGFAGHNAGVIENSYAAGNVNGASKVGGFAGSTDGGEISESFARGTVMSSGDFAGGFIGSSSGSTITDAYARGNVTGASKVGGLLGESAGDTVISSYSTGLVSGTAQDPVVGGLIGATTSATSLTASFWDEDTSQQQSSAGGSARSTEQMKLLATFTDDLDEAEAWSIVAAETGDTTWGVCTFANSGYPFLMWQSAGESGSPGQVSCSPPPPTVIEVEPTPTTVPPSTTTPPPAPAPTPVPVTSPDGQLPQLRPGDSQVLVDGEPVEVEVLIENDTNLVMRGQDFELRLEAECAGTCNIVTTADGRQALLLEQEGLAEVGGFGFQAGSPVYVWLFSDPKFLGELTVNPDGTFTGFVPLGDIAPGEHTMQVNGTSFDGLPRSANLGVIVNPPGGVTLPEAGTDTDMTPWMILLLGSGGLLVVLGRRRGLLG